MVRAEQMTTGELADWYFGACGRWPQVFSLAKMTELWYQAVQLTLEPTPEAPEGPERALAGLLRAAFLRQLRPVVGACTACSLAANRLPAKAILDDGSLANDPFAEPGRRGQPIGPLGAEIMLLGEHGGDLEARTGQPLVSPATLRGSLCARECGQFEACYPAKGPIPAQPCRPEPLRDRLRLEGDSGDTRLLEIWTTRAGARFPRQETAGSLLDQALLAAGEWREGWNPALALQAKPVKQPRPGSVYLTELVRCASPEAPTPEQVGACRRFLEIQLYVIQPKVIVTLGHRALELVTGQPGLKMLSVRGQLFQGAAPFDRPVLAEVHPQYLLKQQSEPARQEFLAHMAASFRQARRIVQEGIEPEALAELGADLLPLQAEAEGADRPREATFGRTFAHDPALEQTLFGDEAPEEENGAGDGEP